MIKKNQEFVSWTQKIPITYDCDVVVVGGGIAGVSAACMASKMGMEVILIERLAILGGNGTAGGVTGFCGAKNGQGIIFDEMTHDLEQFNAIDRTFDHKKTFLGGRRYDHEILAVILPEITRKYNVKILLHTRFIGAITDSSKIIESIIIAGKTGIEAIHAKIYIDCSGEADLCKEAGFECMKGRPEDGLQLPMSLNYFIRFGNRFKRFKPIPIDYFKMQSFQQQSDLPMTSFWHKTAAGQGLKIKIPMFDATNTESLTEAEIQARRKMMQVLEFYQSKKRKRWELDHCSSIIGIREGRRIIGEYILSLDDLRHAAEFEDAIAVGTYPLDAHKPDDDKRTYLLPKKSLKVPPYQIPLRCLIPKGATNLLVAGRNFSAEQLAMSSARVMTTCSMMGHAAGITAAICIKNNGSLRNIWHEKIEEIQMEIKNNHGQLTLEFYR